MKKLFSALLVFTFISLSIAALAQAPPPPPGNPSGGGGGGPVGAPIDGGLGILLAMGAAYGGKKLYQIRRKKEAAEN
ncbi:MAG: hypothetical protein WCI71_10795 [Bacteroidota bacterium]